MVDFANASLYLGGLQTVFSLVCTAVVSVLACWLVPEGGVSAVRTLALCAAVGALLMRKPLRVGRAHGVHVIFSALQPALPLYLLSLVTEQLIHTCSVETNSVPSWRRVVFHAMILAMTVSGMMSARAPMGQTDVPFLITAVALLVVALLPPPAQALVGPLCQSVSLWEASDRLVRAFAFATLYCAHVYASTSSNGLDTAGTWVVVTRSASSSIWTMGAHIAWLPIAVAQCAIVILSRLRLENAGDEYRPLSPRHHLAVMGGGGGSGSVCSDAPLPASALSDDDAPNEAATAAARSEALEHVVVGDPLEEQRRLLADTPHAVPPVGCCAASGTMSKVPPAPVMGGFFRNALMGSSVAAAVAAERDHSPLSASAAAAGAAPEQQQQQHSRPVSPPQEAADEEGSPAIAPFEAAEPSGDAAGPTLGGPLRFRELPALAGEGEAGAPEGAAAAPSAPRMSADDMTEARMAEIVSGLV